MTILLATLPIQAGDRVAVYGIPGERAGAQLMGVELTEWAPANPASPAQRPRVDHAVLAVNRLGEAREIDVAASVRRGGSVALALPVKGAGGFAARARARRMLRDSGVEPTQTCWLIGPWRDPVIAIPGGSAARLRWLFTHLVVPWSRHDVLQTVLGRWLPTEWLAPALVSGVAVIGRCERGPDDRP